MEKEKLSEAQAVKLVGEIVEQRVCKKTWVSAFKEPKIGKQTVEWALQKNGKNGKIEAAKSICSD